MLGNRRRQFRHVINQAAKFRGELGSLPRDCMVTDISSVGARLSIDAPDVPDQFHLTIGGEQGSDQECRVVWRLGGEIGVAFVGPRLPRATPQH